MNANVRMNRIAGWSRKSVRTKCYCFMYVRFGIALLQLVLMDGYMDIYSRLCCWVKTGIRFLCVFLIHFSAQIDVCISVVFRFRKGQTERLVEYELWVCDKQIAFFAITSSQKSVFFVLLSFDFKIVCKLANCKRLRMQRSSRRRCHTLISRSISRACCHRFWCSALSGAFIHSYSLTFLLFFVNFKLICANVHTVHNPILDSLATIYRKKPTNCRLWLLSVSKTL